MKSSCISHDKREPLIIIRKSYVNFCEGNHCSAALISFFEYWHNIKLDMQSRAEKANAVAVNHGDEPTQDTSLFQFHTADELSDGLVGLFKIGKIRDSIEQLKSLGVLSVHKNPNPRYKFDNTRYFLFNPDAVYSTHRHDEKNTSSDENGGRSVENGGRSVENSTTITETPSETTTDIICDDVAVADIATEKQDKQKQTEANKATWDAYAAAYEKRYKVAPLRNAQANGIISKFVKAVGQENAPMIARYFINIGSQIYISRMHDLKLLAADAQAVRTQWMTQTTMSAAKAKQEDGLQAAKSAAEGAAERYAKRHGIVLSDDVLEGEFKRV